MRISSEPASNTMTRSKTVASDSRCPKCGLPICDCLLNDPKFLATKVGQLLRGKRHEARPEPLVAHSAGPIRLDNIMIHCGDCLDVIPNLPDVAVVVTSIPYNIGVNYGETYNDSKPQTEYLAWLRARFEAIRGRLQDDGSFFLNMDGDGWTPFQVAGVLQPLFCLQNRIEWVKSLVVPERKCPHCAESIPSQQIGHFTSLHGDTTLNRCGEFVLHLTKHRNVSVDRQTIGVRQADTTNTTRYGSPTHCAGNQWFVPYETRTKEAGHPCPFPVHLAKRCIMLHGLRKPNLVVLDPFMGLGSSMRAVAEINREYGLNVRGIGVEINPEYCRRAMAFLQGESQHLSCVHPEIAKERNRQCDAREVESLMRAVAASRAPDKYPANPALGGL